jgi:ABC-type lipoprotein release transport system permease subunit
VSLGAAALVMVGAVIVATWSPASRAMRVDPMEVLRAQ